LARAEDAQAEPGRQGDQPVEDVAREPSRSGVVLVGRVLRHRCPSGIGPVLSTESTALGRTIAPSQTVVKSDVLDSEHRSRRCCLVMAVGSASRNARALARAELVRQIKRVARQQLTEVGAAALSIRAVTRELGMVSSAIYRYFPSRDDLLTTLIIETYDTV